MKKILFLAIAFIGLMSSCGHKEYPAIGDTHIKVFDKANVCFQPGKYENFTEADADGVIRLVNGRIILTVGTSQVLVLFFLRSQLLTF